ncbi:hypothetical protein [Methyloglobulus sp.]|uniref:hypothetical protein n=1 Tax=Methyloglobulus sp. TaxID=2518622 RepID=UPI003989415E
MCGERAGCKDGLMKGRQRYLCKGFNRRYTVAQRSGTGDKAAERQALELYLEAWVQAVGRHKERRGYPNGRSGQDARPCQFEKTIAGYGLPLVRHWKRFLCCIPGPRGTVTGGKP